MSEPRRHPNPQYNWLHSIPFLAFHLSLFVPLYTGIRWELVLLCVASYYLRMFGVTAGYHRYFSHRTFKTGRVFQFLVAFLAQSSVQKGVLWWASHHRLHHRASDTPEDVHSPVQHGFFWSHIGWIISDIHKETRLDRVRDTAKYPEIRWLETYCHVPTVTYAAAMLIFFGWEGLLWGFFISTTLLFHGTFTINSLTHVIGRRVYETSDNSRNSLLLALITLGEGWHNNHHHYPYATAQGYHWWQVDPTYYVLKGLSFLRIVSDVKRAPAEAMSKSLRQPSRGSRETLSAQASPLLAEPSLPL